MYAAQQAQDASAGGDSAEAEPESDQGDVVDAEFEEVKEDKRA